MLQQLARQFTPRYRDREGFRRTVEKRLTLPQPLPTGLRRWRVGALINDERVVGRMFKASCCYSGPDCSEPTRERHSTPAAGQPADVLHQHILPSMCRMIKLRRLVWVTQLAKSIKLSAQRPSYAIGFRPSAPHRVASPRAYPTMPRHDSQKAVGAFFCAEAGYRDGWKAPGRISRPKGGPLYGRLLDRKTGPGQAAKMSDQPMHHVLPSFAKPGYGGGHRSEDDG